jgi:hypothetical protein
VKKLETARNTPYGWYLYHLTCNSSTGTNKKQLLLDITLQFFFRSSSSCNFNLPLLLFFIVVVVTSPAEKEEKKNYFILLLLLTVFLKF